jgi:hypothetical protein
MSSRAIEPSVMFQPTAETAKAVLQTSGVLSHELDLLANRGEETGDPKAKHIALARQVIGERLLALLSTMASQRASYDPGARIQIVFLYRPYRDCSKKQRFTPEVESALIGRLGLIADHAEYLEAAARLAEEFCEWTIGKEQTFLHDEEGNLFLLCLPIKPYLRDLASESSSN